MNLHGFCAHDVARSSCLFIFDELRMSSCCRACVVAVVLSAFKCLEVGLEFCILGVQKFD